MISGVLVKERKNIWIGIILLLLTILTGSWLADGIKGEALFSDWFPVFIEWKWRTLTISLSLVLFVVPVIWLYRYRKIFLGVRTLEQIKTRAHPCLILLLSTPNIVPANLSFPLNIRSKNTEAVIKGESLKYDIVELNKIRWNWQQLLRGLLPHQSELKYAYLIGSSGGTGSFQHLDKAEMLIKRYCPSSEIIKPEKAVDFENLEELTDSIFKAILELERKGMKGKDIIIDVTGGKKTTSIAGAIVTLNSDVTFQYVQTDIADPDVISYNVDIQSPLSL